MDRRTWLKSAAGVFAGIASARIVRAQPAPPPPPAAFGAAVSGLRLGLRIYNAVAQEVILENVSSAPITVLSHVNAGREHLDWYTLRIAPTGGTGAVHVIRFVEARDRAATVTRVLQPGENVVHTLDLPYWTALRANAIPSRVASGTYQLTATYDTQDPHYWRGSLISGTITSAIQA